MRGLSWEVLIKTALSLVNQWAPRGIPSLRAATVQRRISVVKGLLEERGEEGGLWKVGVEFDGLSGGLQSTPQLGGMRI